MGTDRRLTLTMRIRALDLDGAPGAVRGAKKAPDANQLWCGYKYRSFLQHLVEHSAADSSHLQTASSWVDGGHSTSAGDTPLSFIWGTVYLADSIWGTFGVQIKIPNNSFPPIIVRQ